MSLAEITEEFHLFKTRTFHSRAVIVLVR